MEALQHLMGAYFHQDWALDGGDSAATVSQFLREPEEMTRACADQIDLLVHRVMAEGELQRQLSQWGCAYRAGASDDDYRRWLTDVKDQLRASPHAD